MQMVRSFRGTFKDAPKISRIIFIECGDRELLSERSPHSVFLFQCSAVKRSCTKFVTSNNAPDHYFKQLRRGKFSERLAAELADFRTSVESLKTLFSVSSDLIGDLDYQLGLHLDALGDVFSQKFFFGSPLSACHVYILADSILRLVRPNYTVVHHFLLCCIFDSILCACFFDSFSVWFVSSPVITSPVEFWRFLLYYLCLNAFFV